MILFYFNMQLETSKFLYEAKYAETKIWGTVGELRVPHCKLIAQLHHPVYSLSMWMSDMLHK